MADIAPALSVVVEAPAAGLNQRNPIDASTFFQSRLAVFALLSTRLCFVVYDIGIEKWYDALKEHTFETEWLSLSRAEAGAIVRKCESTQVIGRRPGS
jgi:hypothetical protein